MSIVILVHGFLGSYKLMAPMATYLRKAGFTVFTPAIEPSYGTIPIEQLAMQLAAFIENNIAADARINLVGHSMGGLICRYYLQFLKGYKRTDKFIAISTPHYGTKMAHLFPGKAVKQMRPNSAFLSALNNNIIELEGISFTNFYTPLDATIIPFTSSIFSLGKSFRFWVPFHSRMIFNKGVFKKITELLSLP